MIGHVISKSLKSMLISLGGIVLATVAAWQTGLDQASLWYPVLYGLSATLVNGVREALKYLKEENGEE